MVNLKFLQRCFMFLFVGTSMCVLQACSDDDEESGGSLNTDVGEVVAGSGEKLLSAGDYNFYYSEDGKIKYATDDWTLYEFSSNQLICYEDYDYGETDKSVTSLSYNGEGYISKMHLSEVWDEEGERGSYSSTSNLAYDGEGHLTKVTVKYSGEYAYDGETERESGTSTINLTWDDGCLVKYEYVASDNEGWTNKETATFDYEDGEYANEHKQYATFADDLFGDEATVCAYIGLFGKGPDYLPAKVELEEVEIYDGEEEYSYDYTAYYAYSFNDDGTIRRVNSDYFTYGTIEEQGDIDDYQAKVTRTEKSQKRNFVFGSRLKNHKR